MSVSINTPTIELDERDTEFIQEIQNRITSYGQIPYEVPIPMIVSIIKECAKFFYKYYWYASEKLWGIIEKKYVNRVETNNGSYPRNPVLSYFCVLPKAVKNIIEVHIKGSQSMKPTMYQSVANSMQLINRQYSLSASSGYGLVGINNNLYVEEVVSAVVQDVAFESCCTAMVPFNFNIYTKRLNIHQEVKNDLIILYIKNCHLHVLYEDELFLQYTLGKCKRELKRVLGSHSIDLPGGVSLNVDEICDNLEVIGEIEEKLKNGSNVGDVILYRH